MNPYTGMGNNPMFFTDPSGDSLITVVINDQSGFIHGDNEMIIDHTYLTNLTNILQAAADNGVNIHINSSFREMSEQMSVAIQQGGTTPAGSGSRHLAGFGIDFNLYRNNDVDQGFLGQNADQNTNNNDFLSAIITNGSRWGGNFVDAAGNPNPDPIHFDAGNNTNLQNNYGVNFTETRDFNQTQYSERGVTRSVNQAINYNRPVPGPMNIPIPRVLQPAIFGVNR